MVVVRVTKAEFMIRLKKMVDYVTSNNERIDLFCPGSIHVHIPYYVEHNHINKAYCNMCQEVMDAHLNKSREYDPWCPCNFHPHGKALQIAKEKIRQYFK